MELEFHIGIYFQNEYEKKLLRFNYCTILGVQLSK